MRARLRILARLSGDPELRSLALADLGFGLTEFGSWIAILLYAFERGGVVESGIVGATMLLAPTVVVPFAPYAAERMPKHHALAAGYALISMASALAAVALAMQASAIVIYAALLVLCMGVSFVPPLVVSVLVSMTRTVEDLTAANVADGLIDSGANLLGPLLVAAILPFAGLSALFGVTAVLTAASCLLVLRLDSGFVKTRSAPGPMLTKMAYMNHRKREGKDPLPTVPANEF